jgi:hypothetical protein
MTRGKIVAALLGSAGVSLMALGLGSTPAAADPYCGPGYHWYAGYCYPNPVVYAPPAPVYYPAPYYPSPVVVGPSIGFTFGFGGHHFHR